MKTGNWVGTGCHSDHKKMRKVLLHRLQMERTGPPGGPFLLGMIATISIDRRLENLLDFSERLIYFFEQLIKQEQHSGDNAMPGGSSQWQ